VFVTLSRLIYKRVLDHWRAYTIFLPFFVFMARSPLNVAFPHALDMLKQKQLVLTLVLPNEILVVSFQIVGRSLLLIITWFLPVCV
jgi:hypothetical protein